MPDLQVVREVLHGRGQDGVAQVGLLRARGHVVLGARRAVPAQGVSEQEGARANSNGTRSSISSDNVIYIKHVVLAIHEVFI